MDVVPSISGSLSTAPSRSPELVDYALLSASIQPSLGKIIPGGNASPLDDARATEAIDEHVSSKLSPPSTTPMPPVDAQCAPLTAIELSIPPPPRGGGDQLDRQLKVYAPMDHQPDGNFA